MAEHSTEITLYGLELEVLWSYHPPERGHRNSYGAPEEPDYPEEIEVQEILHCGQEILCLMDQCSIDKARDLALEKERG